MSTFDITKKLLPDIMKQITERKIQLPDFQRGWVWDDDHIQSLLVSIARSFPVGAVMLLETGGEAQFQARPLENVPFPEAIPRPEYLILDGQQRLTSLTQVLALETPVKTFNEKDKPINRYYYINIKLALEEDSLEDVFIAVEEDRKIKTNFGRDIRLDLSTPQKECEEFYFPCNQILNSDAWEESLHHYVPGKLSEYMRFRRKVVFAFRNYGIPLIVLGSSASKEAVCFVFEKVNTGGVSLSVFDLVTASFAAEDFNLRDAWYGNTVDEVQGRSKRIGKEPVLGIVEPTDFLQAISLLHTYERRQADLAAGRTGRSASAVSAKRTAILSLRRDDYRKWADEVEKGFLLAAKFLRKECFFSSRDLPYRTQLIPLAAVLSRLKERWLEPRIYEKLCRWFWCGVLGELYRGAVETRIANDIEELLDWIDMMGGNEPRTISEASFNPRRLDTLRSRASAAYKGLNVLILRNGAKDFFWNATIQELDHEGIVLDTHHIFPKAWCETKSIKPSIFNSIINKTPISYKANRRIGGNAPSRYLASIQSHRQVNLDNETMDAIIQSHLIDPTTLRTDDFEQFYACRRERLLGIVEQVMGKEVDRDAGQQEETDGDE